MTQIRSLADEPRVGDILLYKMRLEDYPNDPNQIWHGVIKLVLMSVGDRHQSRYYLVYSVEHPDCEEFVYPSQYVGYQKYNAPYPQDKRW